MISTGNEEAFKINEKQNKIIPENMLAHLQSMNTQEPKKKKLFEIWPGNNRFYWGGRLVHGPNLKGLTIISIAKIIINGIFYGVIAPYLWQQYEMYYFLTATIFLLIMAIIFMLLTAFTDPGIIPRKDIINLINIDNSLSCFIKTDEEDKENMKNFNFKFCLTCRIYRPPMTAHCL